MLTTYLNKLRLFNRDVRLYLVSWSIVGFNHMGIITVLFNLYLLRLGHGPQFVGIVNGSAWIAYSVTCLPAGALGKRWGSRTLMVAGMLIITIGMGLVLIAESLPNGCQQTWIATFYSVTWMGAALYVVSGMPFLSGATSDQERNHAFAIRTALNNVSGFIGSLIAGILPGLFARLLGSSLEKPAPYRYPLWIACALYGAAVFVILGTGKIENRPIAKVGNDSHSPNNNINQPAPYGLILLFSLVMLLTHTGAASLTNFFNVYLDTTLATPTILIGGLSAVKQLLSILIALMVPVMMARWGKERTIVFGFFMRSFSLLPIALFQNWVGAGLGYIGAVSFMSLTLPAFGVYQQESVSPKWRVAMSGAVNTAMGIGGAIMAYGGAYIITSWGYRLLFMISAGLVAVGTLIFWVYTRKTTAMTVAE